MLRAAADDGAVDAQPGLDVFLAQILEELLQVAHDAALEAFDEFAALVRDADEHLAAILGVAETFDQARLDQPLDQAGRRRRGVAHQFGQLRHVQAGRLIKKAKQRVLGNGNIAAVNLRRQFDEKRALKFCCDFGEFLGQVSVLINRFHMRHYLSNKSFSQ